jgi:4,5-dihydroxyphthalate decarboxylase
LTTDLDLTIAIGDYDQVSDLTSGRISVPGVRLRPLHLPVEQIFGRLAAGAEWEISEFSMGKFSSMVAAGEDSLVGLPIFPSRVFRHSSIYVGSDSSLAAPEDLAGKRIGIPEWAQTASIYTRGILAEHHGVALDGVQWFQAGVNEPGRREKVRLSLPEGVSVTPVPDRSLSEMLVSGQLDAVMSARPPAPFTDGMGTIRRLIADYPAVERAYFDKTGVFPIMHGLVLRRDVHERHPWVARNLLEGFEAAKQASLVRMRDVTASWLPLPWIAARTAEAEVMFGEDPWPYGVESNWNTLDTFLRYGFEQGTCVRRLAPEELFPRELATTVLV